MNLRELCQIPDLPNALLTTYNIDPLFFERVVLTDLIHGGANRIIVLADAEQAMSSIGRVREQLLALGRRYRLIPIQVKGAFHPKLCLRIGNVGAAVACGSHNLTRAGWLGCRRDDDTGGNRELSVAWNVLSNGYAARDLIRGVEELANLCITPQDRREVIGMIPDSWRRDTRAAATERWSWAVTGATSTLAARLAQRWQGRRFERLRISCGSTDEQGAMLRWAAETFGVSEAVVELDLAYCGFNPARLADLPLRLQIVAYDGKPRTHLKVVIFESKAGCAAVVGSANCSGAAWLRATDSAGNIESVVIFDECNKEDFEHLLRSDIFPLPWENVEFPTIIEQPATTAPTDYQLRQLQLHRAAGELIAIVKATIPDDSSAFAVIQGSRVPLRHTTIRGQYRGPMPDLIEGPESIFGYVEWQTSEGTQRTNEIWLDDVDRLIEAVGKRYPFNSLRNLSASAMSTDHKRMLEDIHILSQALLTAPDAFPDCAVRECDKRKTEPDKPALPVTDEDVIRKLDQLSSRQQEFQSVSGHGGAVTLTGIMRLLFTDQADSADIDPTVTEFQRSNEEQEADQSDQPARADTKADTSDTGPSEAQRQRLLEQLRKFLDRLAELSFASRCSARQLQQAAAFPLAICQFAGRGPWVEEGERGVLGEAIQRTCELLLYRDHAVLDSKTKKTDVRRPLIVEVRERYATEGREADFEEIIGDGTLWLVLMGALTMFSGSEEQLFARNLVLRDIARYPMLSVEAIPEQLAVLAHRISADLDVNPITRAKRAVSAFGAVESYLTVNIDKLKQHPCSSAQVSDSLWKDKMGFAQVIELIEGGKAKVHIRKRAETVNNVFLSFYLNLRVIAEIDADFKTLFRACCAV